HALMYGNFLHSPAIAIVAVEALPGGAPWMRAGRIVDFLVYSDGDGLGAEEARALLKQESAGRPERSECAFSLSSRIKGSHDFCLAFQGKISIWWRYLADSEHYLSLMSDLGQHFFLIV
ncbi:unnamed protein product, partial [Symbiodinium natans]